MGPFSLFRMCHCSLFDGPTRALAGAFLRQPRLVEASLSGTRVGPSEDTLGDVGAQHAATILATFLILILRPRAKSKVKRIDASIAAGTATPSIAAIVGDLSIGEISEGMKQHVGDPMGLLLVASSGR
jgi:hypothetical protein